MALSPFKFDAKRDRRAAQRAGSSGRDRLSLSQALTITAGLAGLVGLCSGVVIRFSLANSSNARFLSPLQTFPALSNWTTEPSSDVSGRVQSPPDRLDSSETAEDGLVLEDQAVEGQVEAAQSVEDIWREDSRSSRTDDARDISTFDTFSSRAEEPNGVGLDPFQRLEKGPQLGRLTDDYESDAYESDAYESGDEFDKYEGDSYVDEGYEGSYYERAYDEPQDEYEYEAPYAPESEAGDRYFYDDAGDAADVYSPEEGY